MSHEESPSISAGTAGSPIAARRLRASPFACGTGNWNSSIRRAMSAGEPPSGISTGTPMFLGRLKSTRLATLASAVEMFSGVTTASSTSLSIGSGEGTSPVKGRLRASRTRARSG